MWLLSPVLLLAGIVSAHFSLATPFEDLEGRSFSVSQVRKHKYQRNGAFALANAYLKFGKTVPTYILTAVELTTNATLNRRATTGSAVTTPETGDTEYLTPVSIGKNNQVLNLDFDTGSSDFWVMSTLLSQSLQSGHSVYNAAASSTSKLLSGYNWTIGYGDGSTASGAVYNDTVTIGGVSFAKQAVEAAIQISNQFAADADRDGLVGFAFSKINTVTPIQQKTFFDNVKSTLAKPIFAADLKHNQPGAYDFGFTNSSRYTGSISYTNVDSSRGFWGFNSSGYKVSSQSYTSTISGIADTGTTLLLLPDTVLANYYGKITGSQNSTTYGGWVFPCAATIPTFTYMIGSLGITIPASYLNYAALTTGSSALCFGSLQSSRGIGINIYGDIALKAAYVVFNSASTPQIGFAAKKLT